MREIYSHILKQTIKVYTNSIVCSDGVVYNKDEINILNSKDVESKLAYHKIKNMFGGEILK